MDESIIEIVNSIVENNTDSLYMSAEPSIEAMVDAVLSSGGSGQIFGTNGMIGIVQPPRNYMNGTPLQTERTFEDLLNTSKLQLKKLADTL